MNKKIENLIQGKTFEQLRVIYEGFIAREFNIQIEMAILNKMAEVDEKKFKIWDEKNQ